MSIDFHNVSTSTPAPECADHDKFLFGNSVRARREELGISIFEAAELSGLAIYQWAAVEEGCWVPDNRNVIRSMAGALEANGMQMILVASLSARAQSGYKTSGPQL